MIIDHPPLRISSDIQDFLSETVFNPHILQVIVPRNRFYSPARGLKLETQHLLEIIRDEIREEVGIYEAFFSTRFFQGWVILIPTLKEFEDINGTVSPIQRENFEKERVFPVLRAMDIKRTKMERRGQERQPYEIVAKELFLTVGFKAERLLAGAIDVYSNGQVDSRSEAIAILKQHMGDAGKFVGQATRPEFGEAAIDLHDREHERRVKEIIQEGPRLFAAIYGIDSNDLTMIRRIGQVVFEQGQHYAQGQGKVSGSNFEKLLEQNHEIQRQLRLVKAAISVIARARQIRDAERKARSMKEDREKIVNRVRNSWFGFYQIAEEEPIENLLIFAFEYERNFSGLYGALQFLEPFLEAARILGRADRTENGKLIADPSLAGDWIGLWGLKALIEEREVNLGGSLKRILIGWLDGIPGARVSIEEMGIPPFWDLRLVKPFNDR